MGVGSNLRFGYNGAAPSGRLFGTTKTAGTPDAPASRLVHLIRGTPAIRGMLVGDSTPLQWVQSDTQGNWEFGLLDPSLRYHVIAYDHTGVHDPVIKMNLVPTVG